MRMRVTVRGEGTEIRGYATIEALASLTSPPGEQPYVVIASPATDDFNPFGVSDPENPPTLEKSRELIESWFSQFDHAEELFAHLADVHFNQALVIRGERWRAEQMEREMLSRELHHFETEQENERLKANLEQEKAEHESTLHVGQDYLRVLDAVRAARSNHPECEKHPDDDAVSCGWKVAVQDIDRALS